MSSPGVPDQPPPEDPWVSHRDFYVPPGQTPGLPSSQPNPEQLRRHRWGPIRRAPSWILIGFITLWRRIVSPLYGQVCTYYPSCSAYGLEAVTVHGLLRGAALTLWRILRCNPFSSGGIDHVPASGRLWRCSEVPEIVRLNHPPMDPDDGA